MATREGTWRYRNRFADAYGRTFFRRLGPGVVASVGTGTYLGAPTDTVDERYHDALVTALESGSNLLDTAVNYRHQRSERVVGDALTDADVDRGEVVVATKGGFIPFDNERPADPEAYVRTEFIEGGAVDADELVAGRHCLAPAYIDASLDRSLDNLGVEAVDLYYLHNPEKQLETRSRDAVYDAIEEAFVRLERRRGAGQVQAYGVATWDGFRVPPDDDTHLSLHTVVDRAERAAERAGRDPSAHGFAAVQLPFNAAMADASTVATHELDGERTSALETAAALGVDVFTSASLHQGELTGTLPAAVAAVVAGDTPAQKAINFARSAPAVTSALVGTSDERHVAENLGAGTFDPLGARAFDAVVR